MKLTRRQAIRVEMLRTDNKRLQTSSLSGVLLATMKFCDHVITLDSKQFQGVERMTFLRHNHALEQALSSIQHEAKRLFSHDYEGFYFRLLKDETKGNLSAGFVMSDPRFDIWVRTPFGCVMA